MRINNYKIAINQLPKAQYPDYPYSPSTEYPELFIKNTMHKDNYVYKAVREIFHNLGYDAGHYGSTSWNPLGEIIKPGMKVVIKPNFVLSSHSLKKDVYSIITHPSLIRVVADYCLKALNNTGVLIIADAPQYNCNFKELLKMTKLDKMVNFLQQNTKTKIELLDLRNYWSTKRHFPSYMKLLPGDPMGEALVNLKDNSALKDIDPERFYGAVYDRKETRNHHMGNKQEYKISKTILNSDVYISIPKMKVHKKVGVTLNLKNLVGICTNKNYLVHYSLGLPSEGGDQFPENVLTNKQRKIIKFERWMYDTFLAPRTILGEYIHRFIYGFLYLKIFRLFDLDLPPEKRMLDAGNWYGNDTAWRMVTDIYKIILYSNKNGVIKNIQQRKTFSIIDGVMGGENNGPLEPDPVKSGVILAGQDLLLTDIVTSKLMGFDFKKLKQFNYFNKFIKTILNHPEKVKIFSNIKAHRKALIKSHSKYYNYRPHPGWGSYLGYEK